MTNVTELLAQYASTPPAPTANIGNPVMAAVRRQEGIGAMGLTDVENDLNTMNPAQLSLKYGADNAAQMMNQRLQGSQQLSNYQYARDQRTLPQVISDTGSGVATGFLGSVAGIGALGLGAVNQEAGTWAADQIQSGNEWVQENLQSRGLNAARQMDAARNALDEADNKLLAEQERMMGQGEQSTAVNRFLRDAADTVGNAISDPVIAAQGTAEAVGSLAAGGPISKGFKAIGSGVVKAAGIIGKVPAAAIRTGNAVAMPATIAAMEAGGAYQQTSADIMGRSHEQLMKESPTYRELIAGGMKSQDAKTQIANDAGLTAAAIQAPIAAATGALVAPFEAAPFAGRSLSNAIGNFAKETVEEGIQSTTGQIAQNYADRKFANEKAELVEGVGAQAGLGALYGFTATGAVQAPAAVLNGTKSVGKLTMQGLRGAVNTVADRVAQVEKQNNEASPVSERAMRAETAAAVEQAPVNMQILQEAVDATDSTPEAKAEAQQYIADLDSLLAVPEGMVGDPSIPPYLVPAIEGAANRVEAIQNLAALVREGGETEEGFNAAMLLTVLSQEINDFRIKESAALDQLDGNAPAKKILSQYQNLVSDMDKSPTVNKMVSLAKRKMDLMDRQSEIDSRITDDNIETPDGQLAARTVVAAAEVNPGKVPRSSIDHVLYQNSRGRFNLSDSQRAALEMSRTLLDAAERANAEAQRLGLRAQDIVSKQITTDTIRTNEGSKSAESHTQSVLSAMRAGQPDIARALLADFGMFVDHMNNKVAAANEHFAGGDPKAPGIQYQALQPDRSWKPSAKGIFVNTGSTNSLELNNQMALETQTVTDVFNGLAEAFPSLQVPTKTAVTLNPALVGEIQTVADSFRRPQAQPRTEETKAETVESKPEEVQTAVTESTPPVVEEAPVAVAEPAVEETAPVVEETQTETVVEEPVVTEPVSAMDELYPSVSQNFKDAFRVPEEAQSKLYGLNNPLEYVFNLFQSSDTLRAHIGDKLKAYLTPDILGSYQAAMNWGLSLEDTLNKQLAEYLDAPYSKTNKTSRRELIQQGAAITTGSGETITGRQLMSRPEGMALNILDADLNYDPTLIQTAVLAGIDFRINANQYIVPMDAEALNRYTGLSDAQGILDSDKVAELTQGVSTAEAKRQLAQKISSYWGLDRNNNTSLSYSQGIPEAIAAEIIRALVADGTLEEVSVDVDGALYENGEKRTFNRYVPKGLPTDMNEVQAFPNAIEQVVKVVPEQTHYIGEKVPTVARTQMNNPQVENTKSQRDAIRNKQDVPFNIHMPMVNVYAAMSERGVVELFGTPENPSLVLNETHKASIEGKNRSIVAGYQSLLGVVMNTMNIAEAQGVDVGAVDIHYARNMSRVGRMQMLGAHSPQANKLVREAILPTWATLDLNEGTEHLGNFKIAIGQHLGVKVHNMTRDAGIRKTDGWIESLAPAIDVLGQMTDQNYDLQSSDIQTIKDAFALIKQPVTPGAIHALVEYSRYQQSDDKSAFRTALYLEADGVTNGPINAMGLMSVGKFVAKWLKNIAKGGIFFGARQTTNDHRAFVDDQDLYKAATTEFAQELAKLRKTLGQSDERMMHNFLTVMGILNPDITYDGKSIISLDRGIAKNPLTITIYGSGEQGIAGNFQQALTKTLYTKLSDLATAMHENPGVDRAEGMFPDNPAQYARLRDALRIVSGINLDSIDPVSFSIQKDQAKFLTKAAKNYFVAPMVKAINSTVGDPLMRAVTLIRKATQVQSIFAEEMFNNLLQEKMVDRKDFLSPNELNEIYREVQAVYPFVTTGDQTFNIAGSGRTDVPNSLLGAALNGQFRTEAQIFAPTDAGVAGIPFMTIGMGDAVMMQLLALRKPGRTLDVFDGLNVPLDEMFEYSTEANKAVYDSWKGNPFRAVKEAFDASDFSGEISESMHKKLERALYGFGEAATEANIRKDIEALTGHLDYSVRSADARHKAMQSVAQSTDQMAAAGSPYQNDATVDPAMTTDEARLDALNAIYTAEMNPAPAEPTAESPTVEAPAMPQFGRQLSSGVRVMSFTALQKLGRAADMTDAQRVIFGEIMRSESARDYKVVYGSPDQIRDYQTAKGLQVLPSDADIQTVQGYTVFNDKTVYISNPSVETLVHELVHAATLEKMVSHFSGETTPEVTEAIQKITQLKDQFLSSKETGPDVDNARSAIIEASTHSDQAFAQAASLNEFMAWTLANKNLSEAAAKRTAPSLVQMAKDAFNWIKQLVWGRKKAPAAGTDALSNLQFNTGVIMRSQPSIAQVAADAVSFQNDLYGNKDRLTDLANTLATKVTEYMATPINQNTALPNAKVRTAAQNAVDLAVLAQTAFPMTPQEDDAFRHIVAIMNTSIQLDGNAMSEAQALYDHTMRSLTPEMLIDTSLHDPQQRLYSGQHRFQIIAGQMGMPVDDSGRSSLLSVFIGLSMVDDTVRNALSKLDVPKSEKKSGRTLDNLLDNLGTSMMDRVSAAVSGTNNAKNVRDAIDGLMEQTARNVEQTQTNFDVLASKAGGVLDRVNDYMVEGIEALTDKAIAKADQVASSTNSKTVRAIAEVVATVSKMATEKNGELVAQSAVTMANRMNLVKPIHDLMVDLVGRTDNNSAVYDMIKQVRSMVQQLRQQFREHLPGIISNNFSRELTDTEWSTLHTALGKTDLASLRGSMTNAKIGEMFTNDRLRRSEESRLEQELVGVYGAHNGQQVHLKARQLAKHMITGIAGSNLLRNATAISRLLGIPSLGLKTVDQATVDKIDQLTTLYAINLLSAEERSTTVELINSESEGVNFALAYLTGLRETEQSKTVTDSARLNQYKGYIPSLQQQGVQMIVAYDSEFTELSKRSFVRVGDYTGSSLEQQGSRGYYYAPVSGRAAFSQGIIQNARHTTHGVDASTGFTLDNMSAGRITDARTVARLAGLMKSEAASGNEHLMPVYSSAGKVIAFERSMNPSVLNTSVKHDRNLAKMIGVWRGRQVEEILSQSLNERLVDAMKDMYDRDVANREDADQYINLWNQGGQVERDAFKLIPEETKDFIRQKFGNDKFMVRKDMLNDTVGYRAASVGDLWSGNTRWSEQTRQTAQDLVTSMFGNKAYQYMVNGEKIIQNFVQDARTMIVVKSVIVPISNMLSNVYQLVGRGVPLASMVRGTPKKLAEIRSYVNTRSRMVEAEAELLAARGNSPLQRRLENEIRSIKDGHKRLSIWPLIEAGEFTAISDVGLPTEDHDLTSGKLLSWIESKVNKLPPSVRTAGRYALITKDTALYQGLQKSIQYGDFVAKALLYDDLVIRQKKTEDYAKGRITEEFVNYDRLPGRFRGYVESMGLLWFWNFKIRSAKVALSMLRNNPLHSLIALAAPAPTIFGTVGLPIEDNVFAKLGDGSLDYSMGIGQGLRAPMLNPWINLVN